MDIEIFLSKINVTRIDGVKEFMLMFMNNNSSSIFYVIVNKGSFTEESDFFRNCFEKIKFAFKCYEIVLYISMTWYFYR